MISDHASHPVQPASEESVSTHLGPRAERGVVTVDDLAELYRSAMTRLLDQHCPVVQVRHKVKQTAPWYDADCCAARRRSRNTY